MAPTTAAATAPPSSFGLPPGAPCSGEIGRYDAVDQGRPAHRQRRSEGLRPDPAGTGHVQRPPARPARAARPMPSSPRRSRVMAIAHRPICHCARIVAPRSAPSLSIRRLPCRGHFRRTQVRQVVRPLTESRDDHCRQDRRSSPGLGLLIAGTARAEQAAGGTSGRPLRRHAVRPLLWRAWKHSRHARSRRAHRYRAFPAGATPVVAPSGTSLLSGNPLSRWFGGSSPPDGDAPAATAERTGERPTTPTCTWALAAFSGTSSSAAPARSATPSTAPRRPSRQSAGPGQQRASATPVASAAEPVSRLPPYSARVRDPAEVLVARGRSLALLPQVGVQRRGNAASNPRTRPRSRTESARSV